MLSINIIKENWLSKSREKIDWKIIVPHKRKTDSSKKMQWSNIYWNIEYFTISAKTDCRGTFYSCINMIWFRNLSYFPNKGKCWYEHTMCSFTFICWINLAIPRRLYCITWKTSRTRMNCYFKRYVICGMCKTTVTQAAKLHVRALISF